MRQPSSAQHSENGVTDAQNGSWGESHRFVVVYRREEREIPGARENWRGWVVRVPERKTAGEEAPQPLWFIELDELPPLLRRLVDQSRGT
jgi:hypothetical protein